MRVAQLNSSNIVVNVLIVPSVTFFPNCVLAETNGDINDYWDGKVFIAPNEVGYPGYVQPATGG